MWLNAIRFLGAFGDMRHDSYATLFQKFIYGCISWQYTLGLTAFIYYHQKHIHKFISQWEDYRIKHGGNVINYTSTLDTLVL